MPVRFKGDHHFCRGRLVPEVKEKGASWTRSARPLGAGQPCKKIGDFARSGLQMLFFIVASAWTFDAISDASRPLSLFGATKFISSII